MTMNPYLDALSKIPKAETRSFAEIAALAGKPAAARAAGRALSSCPAEAKIPWHRAVNAEGALSIDPERAAVQLERLRAEGARPKDGESVARWAKRRKAEYVGLWKGRRYAPRDDPAVLNFSPLHVEAFESEDAARARGFEPLSTPPRSRRARSPQAESESVPPAVRTNAARGGAPDSSARPTSRALRSVPVRSVPVRTVPLRAVPRRDGSTRPRSAEGEAQRNGPEQSQLQRSQLQQSQLELRLASLDWARAKETLPREGAFVAPAFLTADECAQLRDLDVDDARFERTIQMAPRGYGIGRYRYFAEPLPSPVFELRARLFAELRELAAQTPNTPPDPRTLDEFFAQCRTAGQRRGSSILLRYEKGGVNHPHRDIYGPLWFPYQALVVLSERGRDFDGGEFQLHEKLPDGSVYTQTFALGLGDLCVFASRSVRAGGAGEPSRGTREKPRWRDVEHGMSPVVRGERCALGIVLHLAE
jgi:uncharacterized protein